MKKSIFYFVLFIGFVGLMGCLDANGKISDNYVVTSNDYSYTSSDYVVTSDDYKNKG